MVLQFSEPISVPPRKLIWMVQAYVVVVGLSFAAREKFLCVNTKTTILLFPFFFTLLMRHNDSMIDI